MTISYEWVCEEYDEYGDIIDPMYSKTYKEALKDKVNCSTGKVKIALVKDIGDNENGLQSREYVYVEGDSLPIEFEDGYKIPKKFHLEIKREAKNEKI